MDNQTLTHFQQRLDALVQRVLADDASTDA